MVKFSRRNWTLGKNYTPLVTACSDGFLQGAFNILQKYWKCGEEITKPADCSPLSPFSESDYRAEVVEYFQQLQEIFGEQRQTELDTRLKSFTNDLLVKAKKERLLRFYELYQKYADVHLPLEQVLQQLTNLVSETYNFCLFSYHNIKCCWNNNSIDKICRIPLLLPNKN